MTRTGPVSGLVVDSSGVPLEMVQVQLLGLGRNATTGSTGRFRFEDVPAGSQRLLVRAVGFGVETPAIDVKPGEGWNGTITLGRLAQSLPEIEVKGEAEPAVLPRLSGFEWRRKHGLGKYLTQDQIKQLHGSGARELLDLLRGIAGVKLSFKLGGTTVEFARCPLGVAYWLDGHRYRDGIPPVTPSDIVGIEVYRGVAELPAEFLDDACAAVVIWTR